MHGMLPGYQQENRRKARFVKLYITSFRLKTYPSRPLNLNRRPCEGLTGITMSRSDLEFAIIQRVDFFLLHSAVSLLNPASALLTHVYDAPACMRVHLSSFGQSVSECIIPTTLNAW